MPQFMQRKYDSIKYLLPLATMIVMNLKARFQVAFLTSKDFNPGTTPDPDKWQNVPDIEDPDSWEEYAKDHCNDSVVQVYICAEAGHSTKKTSALCRMKLTTTECSCTAPRRDIHFLHHERRTPTRRWYRYTCPHVSA